MRFLTRVLGFLSLAISSRTPLTEAADRLAAHCIYPIVPKNQSLTVTSMIKSPEHVSSMARRPFTFLQHVKNITQLAQQTRIS